MTAAARTDTVIALVGNPNVGKSTVFNALTNLRQHTGNWPGKTVETARGAYTYHGRSYTLVDLPGAYSLHPGSAEEEVTRDYLLSGEADVTLVVADATCLERNLALALQILEVAWPVVLCVNLLDEAEKKHIAVDLPVLERELGCPVIGTSARGGQGLDKVRQALEDAVLHPAPRPESTPVARVCGDCRECRTLAAMSRASAIVEAAVRQDAEASVRRDRALDRLLTGKAGIPVMLLLLAGVLWLTMVGANVPSELLSGLLMGWQEPLRGVFQALHAPWWLEGALVDGVYRTVAWVVSVMLPPMAIFFPLFTLLEDAGYLPRVAFNLDHFFHRAGAHGRQSLTMCMGLGCNACGVMGCRIIQSPRERLIAILTNAFIPCNGRLPTLTALIAMFFVTGSGLWDSIASAALLMGCIVLAVAMTLWASRFLAGTFLKGEPSSFSLELPPYRAPQVGQVLVRSILDRTLFVLARAVVVAAAHRYRRQRYRGRREHSPPPGRLPSAAGRDHGAGRVYPAGLPAGLPGQRDRGALYPDGIPLRRLPDRLRRPGGTPRSSGGPRVDCLHGPLRPGTHPVSFPLRNHLLYDLEGNPKRQVDIAGHPFAHRRGGGALYADPSRLHAVPISCGNHTPFPHGNTCNLPPKLV